MSDINYKIAGQNIRNQRKLMRYTQAQIAEKIEINTAYLSHIENGTRKAGLKTFTKIAGALNVTLDYILNGSSDEQVEAQIARILHKLKKLPEDKRNLIEYMIILMEQQL